MKPVSYNFMAAVTIHSDFGAPNIKSVTVSVSFHMLALPRLPKVLLVLPLNFFYFGDGHAISEQFLHFLF